MLTYNVWYYDLDPSFETLHPKEGSSPLKNGPI